MPRSKIPYILWPTNRRDIERYEQMMEQQRVSEVARSSDGWWTTYKRALVDGQGSVKRVREILKRTPYPRTNRNYWDERTAFLRRTTAADHPLGTRENPSRHALAIIAWAADPWSVRVSTSSVESD